jgi:membrane protease YdiL (CAAX protease family)
MPPSETLAVLRDAFAVAMLALVVGTALYAVIRQLSDIAWNVEGNVLTRPYGVPDAVAVLLLLALFSGNFFFPAGGEPGTEAASAALDVASLLMQLLNMLVLCLVVLAYLLIRGMNPAEMFGLRQLSVGRVLLFAVVGLIVTGVAMELGMMALAAWNGGNLPDPSAQESVQAFENSSSLVFRILLGLIAVVTAPLTEELLFRGFLYGVVKKGTDRWFAAAFTAAIFAMVHGHVGSAPPLFILGLGLAIAYELTGCLLVPIFMHAMFNAVNIAKLVYEAFIT